MYMPDIFIKEFLICYSLTLFSTIILYGFLCACKSICDKLEYKIYQIKESIKRRREDRERERYQREHQYDVVHRPNVHTRYGLLSEINETYKTFTISSVPEDFYNRMMVLMDPINGNCKSEDLSLNQFTFSKCRPVTVVLNDIGWYNITLSYDNFSKEKRV